MSSEKVDQPGELVFEGRARFAVPLERAALRDARLSWAARGLFAFLWDLPDGWRPCLAHLADMGTDRAHATRSALAELEAVGGVRVEKLRGTGGRLAGQRWVIVSAARWAVEAPLRGAKKEGGEGGPPGCDYPSMEFPETRKNRDSENRRLRFPKHKVPQTEGSPTTTTAARAVEAVVVVSQEDQDQLIWPAGLPEAQLISMQGTLHGKDWPGAANAQALLDELAGQMAVPSKVRNPPGLLRRLLERQRKGEFTLEFGLEVQQIREARRKQQEREAAALSGKCQEPASPGQQGSGTSEIAKRELELQREKFPELVKRKAAKAAAHP